MGSRGALGLGKTKNTQEERHRAGGRGSQTGAGDLPPTSRLGRAVLGGRLGGRKNSITNRGGRTEPVHRASHMNNQETDRAKT